MLSKPIEEIFPNVPEGLDPSALDVERIPEHVAVIMDGNGRWAKQRGNIRLAGHKAGIGAVREAIRTASDLGVRYLTLYSFSTENWNRPKAEVVGLMELFAKTMLAEVNELHKEGVRVMTIGDGSMLPERTRNAFKKAWELTRDNTGMTLLVAVNYGGRQEILHAVEQLVAEDRNRIAAGEDPLPVTADALAARLYTAAADAPDPDLVIRTSGEVRVSNFLLWQIAYSEIYCTDVLWPDFDRYEFLRALIDFQGRNRRFGGVSKA